MRLVVTSDLHYDSRGYLTRPEAVRTLSERIFDVRPDAVVLAGDIAHGLDEFEACVSCFEGSGVPIGVLAGNHDVWRDPKGGWSSEALFFGGELERASKRHGAVWMEAESLVLDGVALVGTMAWYDYSAIDPQLDAAPELIAAAKRHLNNDAVWIDWRLDDRSVAEALGGRFRERLKAAASDPGVRAIAVVTHVPILEAQMTRKPGDGDWGFSNAYFGNLTLGAPVLAERKVSAVISGHTHCGKDATVARPAAGPVRALVVDSDYGTPSFVMVDL